MLQVVHTLFEVIDKPTRRADQDIDAVLRGVSQGASFRQIHHMGVQLVTMRNPLLDAPQADGKGR